jgi:hypothetical protein
VDKRGITKVVGFSLLLSLVWPSLVLAAPPGADLERGKYSVESPASFEAAKPSPAVDEPGVQVLESSANSVVLELTTPGFQVEKGMSADGPCDLITVADYGETDAAGWPRLPVQGAIVGIPSQSDPTLTVIETEVGVTSGRFNLCPVPQTVFDVDMSGNVTYTGEAAIKDAEAYAADGFYPASEAEVVSTGFIRSQRVAQLQLHPFQYAPASGLLRHLTRIQVRLEFNSRDVVSLDVAASPVDDEGAFETILSQTLVNYQEARQWRTKSALFSQLDALPAETQPGYKVLVDEDGIYELGYDDLLSAGVDVGNLDPRTLKLHNRGEEVAIYVAGEEDGSFDAGDHILFYGQEVVSKYTDVNVYWLTWGGVGGQRMGQIDGTPTGLASVSPDSQASQHLEENHSYFSNYSSGPDGDHWYWNYIYTTGSPASNSYVGTLPHVATAPFSATVRGLLKGYEAIPQHHTQVYLNGNLIDEALWASTAEYAFEVSVPHTYLVDGANTIVLTGGISNTEDIILINWLEIDYRAAFTAEGTQFSFGGDRVGTFEYQVGGFATDALDVFDITDASDPARIVGATVEGSGTYTLTFQHTIAEEHDYLAVAPAQRLTPAGIELDTASDLRSTANGADYIIITHGDFYTAMLSLADYRAGQGLRTMVVDVQDVYDKFSYGVFDPEAIRDFLAYAYDNWAAPAPTYVLLAGDGNYDFKNFMGKGEPNYIPPYLASIDHWIGEVAADNRYVCVSGDDVFPDMYLGRLPVKTSAEAANVVAKIINYEQNPADGDWNHSLLFVTDNPDSAGDFYAYSDAVADNYVPVQYATQKIYYGLTHSSSSAAKTAITSAINEGQLIVNYVGHGSTQSWASEGLFGVSRVSTLSNAGRLPFITAMACSDGYYIIPSDASRDLSSTAEAVVRAPGKGAIASWSATGLGLAGVHDYLNKGLFEAIFFDDVIELGPATTQGKLYLYSRTSGYRDQIDEYTLFGDPALRLNVTRGRYASSVTGDWHASSTWSGGSAPVAGDVVTITAGTAVTIDSDTQAYRLIIESGGTLEIPDGTTLNVKDALVNNGTLRQTQDVTGSSDVAFLDAGGYGGVVINANGQALGSTVVEIKGNQDCAGSDDKVVERCFEITPTNTSGLSATVTFYFDSSEIVEGSQCQDLSISHYHDGSWQIETVSARDCSSSPHSITVTDVDGFSPFVIKGDSQPTAVDLVSFTAVWQGSTILVTWETATEIDNVGFNLYRSMSADGPFTKLNSALIPSQSPGSIFDTAYTWLDEDVQLESNYYYKLEDVEAGGTRTMHGPVSSSVQNPTKLTLVSFKDQGNSYAVVVVAGLLFLGINGTIVLREHNERIRSLSPDTHLGRRGCTNLRQS